MYSMRACHAGNCTSRKPFLAGRKSKEKTRCLLRSYFIRLSGPQQVDPQWEFQRILTKLDNWISIELRHCESSVCIFRNKKCPQKLKLGVEVLNQVCGSSLAPISGCTNARGKTSTQGDVQKTPFLKVSLYWLCTTNPASLWTGWKNKEKKTHHNQTICSPPRMK